MSTFIIESTHKDVQYEAHVEMQDLAEVATDCCCTWKLSTLVEDGIVALSIEKLLAVAHIDKYPDHVPALYHVVLAPLRRMSIGSLLCYLQSGMVCRWASAAGGGDGGGVGS